MEYFMGMIEKNGEKDCLKIPTCFIKMRAFHQNCRLLFLGNRQITNHTDFDKEIVR